VPVVISNPAPPSTWRIVVVYIIYYQQSHSILLLVSYCLRLDWNLPEAVCSQCSFLLLQLYETLRLENPDILSKIIPIAGDITLPELGINEQDQKLICEEVSVVIHSAATVKFDEKLKLSINVNVNGTKRIIDLCKRMKHLVVSSYLQLIGTFTRVHGCVGGRLTWLIVLSVQALVHVSTAYANCERDQIDEVIYPPPTDPHKLVQSVEWMNDDIVNSITPE